MEGSFFFYRSVKRRKDLRLFDFIFSPARRADKRIGRDPLVNHPDPRVFHPQDSLRRGRVPVKLKFEANSRQGWGSKIPLFRSALPAARRNYCGHLTQ